LLSWAKIVFSIAATAVRCLAGAWARALRIQ
jgi:ribosomal protein S27E